MLLLAKLGHKREPPEHTWILAGFDACITKLVVVAIVTLTNSKSVAVEIGFEEEFLVEFSELVRGDLVW